MQSVGGLQMGWAKPMDTHCKPRLNGWKKFEASFKSLICLLKLSSIENLLVYKSRIVIKNH